MGEIINKVQVIIHVIMRQEQEFQEDQQTLVGEQFQKETSYYVKYLDSNLNSPTLVKWVEGSKEVWVSRQGDVNVRQHFVPGEETYAIYRTPYGRFSLKTFTKSVEISDTNNTIRVQFISQLGESNPSEHQLTFRFKEV